MKPASLIAGCLCSCSCSIFKPSNGQSRSHTRHASARLRESQATPLQHAHITVLGAPANSRVMSKLRSVMLKSWSLSGTCGASVRKNQRVAVLPPRRTLCGFRWQRQVGPCRKRRSYKAPRAGPKGFRKAQRATQPIVIGIENLKASNEFNPCELPIKVGVKQGKSST